MNKKQASLMMHSLVARQYNLEFVEAKLTDKPWISIFSKDGNRDILPVEMMTIKEGYANLFGFDIDDLRIKIFRTKVVVYQNSKVSNVTYNETNGMVSWTYKK